MRQSLWFQILRWYLFIIGAFLSVFVHWWYLPVIFLTFFLVILSCNVLSLYYNVLPFSIQRVLYVEYRNQLTKKSIHPLVDYPFQIWLEFNLDGHFEEGGLRNARMKVRDWSNNYLKRLREGFPDNDASKSV